MVRDVVHHQYAPFGRILSEQQFFQELDKGRCVLGSRRAPGNRIFQPVVATQDMPPSLAAYLGRRDSLLLASLHPASAQGRVQAQRCFVHKDEFEIVSDGLFLSSSNNSAAWALASLSCKWPRSYFGRRYRYPWRWRRMRKRPSLKAVPVSFSRCSRRRSIVHREKSYPKAWGSFWSASSTVRRYSSPVLAGRPLRGLVASPSIPSCRQRLYQP